MDENTKAKVEARIAEVEKVLDEYGENLGIPNSLTPEKEKVMKYLSMTQGEIAKLTPVECGEIGVFLAQAAFYIQKEYAKHVSRANWANSVIKYVVASEIGQYGKYSSYEERKMLAIKGNDYADKLYQVSYQAQQVADRLNFLANQVKFIADKLGDLKYAKLQQAKGERFE